jgi:hypothetical protein
MSFSQGAPTLPLIGAASNVLLRGSSTTGNAFTVQQLSTGNVFSFVTSTGIPALGASGSGNIGIGTTNRLYPLHVSSSSTTTQFVAAFLQPNSSTGGPYTQLVLGGSTATSGSAYLGFANYGANTSNLLSISLAGQAGSQICVTNTGVGIGITNPGLLFDVYQSTNGGAAARIYNPNTGTSAYSALFFGTNDNATRGGMLMFNSTYTASAQYKPSGTYIYNNGIGGVTVHAEGTSSNVYIATVGSEIMRICGTNSCVGIGTTNPTDQINLASGSIVVTNSAATANGILFNQNSVYGGIDVEGIANTGAQTLNLGINNNRAKPWNSGYLGAWFRVDTRTGFNYKGFHWFRRDATTGTETEIMTLTSDGNLGVGRLYPQTKISVDTSSTTTGLGIYNADVAMMFGNTGGASNFASIQIRAGGSSTGIGTGAYVLALNPEGGSVAIGANSGTSIPSQFYVKASAVSTVRSVPSGTVVTFDKSDGPLLTFRQSQNNGTYSGIVFQDNNIGGYMVYKNYTGAATQYGDYLHIAGYNGVYIYAGNPDTVNPANRTCLISACYNSNGSSGAVNTVNVGIGITNPSNYTLHVNGSQYTNGTIYFPANGTGLNWSGGSQIYDSGNLYIVTDDAMYIQAPTTLSVTSAATTFSGTVTATGLNTLINLYGASARTLNIGQTAYYDPGSQVSDVALNINCGDNQYYEVMVLNKGPYTNTNLDLSWLPNNTTYSGQFQCAGLLSSTSGTIGSTYIGSLPYFYFDDINGGVAPPYLHKLYVYTGSSSAYGMIMNVSAGGSGGTNCGENFTSSVWNSTSTRWTSLGTVNANTTSYLILVTRIY